MLEEIQALLVLQDRDRSIRALETELLAIPGERVANEKLISTSAARLDASKARLREIEVEKKRLELEASAKREQIVRYRQQQMQTRKNEEFAALSHEIEAAERAIREIEDRGLELMEDAESLAQATTAAEAAHATEKSRLEAQIADLEARGMAVDAEISRLRDEAESLAKPIDPDLLDVYRRLFKSKPGGAVVALEGDVCTGCHVKVPTQVAIDVRSVKAIVHCPNCGRILHLPA